MAVAGSIVLGGGGGGGGGGNAFSRVLKPPAPGRG